PRRDAPAPLPALRSATDGRPPRRRPRALHLQGARRGPRRAGLGRERAPGGPHGLLHPAAPPPPRSPPAPPEKKPPVRLAYCCRSNSFRSFIAAASFGLPTTS